MDLFDEDMCFLHTALTTELPGSAMHRSKEYFRSHGVSQLRVVFLSEVIKSRLAEATVYSSCYPGGCDTTGKGVFQVSLQIPSPLV